ncbi:MAG: SGNH/GDSL hydrolase family protein [Muribaculaceae bacterium]|nr:SGNH/GDSL hydrolase family protein [Muribaculaceae bacterium]
MNKNIKIFSNFKNNAAGIWYFSPNEGAFRKGTPCKGFGCIKYAEGSIYTGDIYYDGTNFNKLGYGQQDFTRSNIGDLNKYLGEKKYKFVGAYDYRKTDWIYGNGVLYFTYPDGKPSHFLKGFFSGLDKKGEYKGEFDYSTLLRGYTPDMEFNYNERETFISGILKDIDDSVNKVTEIDTLFFGDSYFELAENEEFAGENTLLKTFGKNCINAGIGGSRFDEWHGYFTRLKGIPQPKNIVINLGFNDLHGGGVSVKWVYENYLKMLALVREYFPKTKVYLIAVVHAPNFPNYLEKENKLNELTKNSAKALDVTVLDWNPLIEQSKDYLFHVDAVHPNPKGYEIFINFLSENIK